MQLAIANIRGVNNVWAEAAIKIFNIQETRLAQHTADKGTATNIFKIHLYDLKNNPSTLIMSSLLSQIVGLLSFVLIK